MSLALYRKYRSKTFDEVVGQEHITATLSADIASDNPSHAYLFTGSRGTGKTSCAKILAKALNCSDRRGGNPCLVCDICRGIDDGGIMDVEEIDAASNNGVDNIRELREQAMFLPAVGRYRVYIIDEVHMLSPGAFNALLKIMEEPPAHVVFILATTEVHKIPDTIISRCRRFDFKRIPSDKISAHLMKISEYENIRLEQKAADLIARVSTGAMRDALSVLDMCAASGEKLDYAAVAAKIGAAGTGNLFEISRAISQNDTAALLQKSAELTSGSAEPERLCEQLTEHFRCLLVCATLKNPRDILELTPDELAEYQKHSEMFTPSALLFIINRLRDCMSALSRSTLKNTELEMTLVRLCLPESYSGADALEARLEKLESALLRMSAGNFAPAQVSAAQTSGRPEEPGPERPQVFASDSAEKTPDKKLSEPAILHYESETGRREPISEPAPPPEKLSSVESDRVYADSRNEDPSGFREIPEDSQNFSDTVKVFEEWSRVLELLKKSNGALYGALLGSTAYERKNFVLIDCKDSLFLSMMRENEYAKESLKKCLLHVTGRPYLVGPYNRTETCAVKPKKEDPLQKFVESLSALPEGVLDIKIKSEEQK